jgi:hypothetical protein
MRGTLLALAVATLAATGAAYGAPKPGEAPNPPLTGETLTGTGVNNIVLNCGASTPSYSFDVSGVATGPYSGTFTEHVSVQQGPGLTVPFTFNPSAGTEIRIDAANGPLDRFDASFTITSPTGTVEGTKSLLTGAAAFSQCADFETVTFLGATFTEPAQLTRVSGSAGTLDYRAAISSPLGQSTDGGTTDIDSVQWVSSLAGPIAPFTFVENFVSTGPLTGPGNSPGTQPGKGCGDANHIHTDRSDCKSK